MTNDPCETCLRWPECNGVDAEQCPLMRPGKDDEAVSSRSLTT